MLSIGIGAAAATRSKAQCIITEATIASPAPAPASRAIEASNKRTVGSRSPARRASSAGRLLRLFSRIDG